MTDKLKDHHKKQSDALEEFNKLLQSFKTTNVPEANWRLHVLLRRLGLTKYEVQAYISLIESGNEQSVTQIVKKTGIPHPRAYDTLRNLVKYGLITPKSQIAPNKDDKQKRTAKTYRSLRPSIGIGNLFAFFQFAKEEAIKELELLSTYKTDYDSGIWELIGRDNIVQIVKLMMNEAEYEILISTTIPFLQMLKRSLISAHKRKVQITCVSNFEEGGDADFYLEDLQFIRLKKRQSFPMPYVVIDRRRAIQWKLRAFDGQPLSDPEHTQAQVIDKMGLIDTLIDHFFFLNWRLGKVIFPFQKSKLPSTFIHSVNIVEEVQKILDKGKDPKVVINGIERKSGNIITIEGVVTKVKKNWENGIFSLIVQTKEGKEKSIGGFGAIYEDIAADSVTITK